MALTQSDIPELMLAGLKTEFDLAYRTTVDNSPVEQIATLINTTLPTQKYAWLGFSPPMREFIDERRPSGIGSQSTEIEDKVFEATLAVSRRAMEDDQLDLIRLRIREMASRVAIHRHQMVVEALANGDTETIYDGNAFFGVRTVAGESVTNVTDSALDGDSIKTAVSAMMSVRDETGTPMGVTPDTLLVGPELMWSAMELVQSPVVVKDSAATNYLNVFQGKLKVLVSPFLTGDDAAKWFVMDTRRPVRPIILQQRSDVPVEFTALEAGSGSEAAFMRDQYLYGVRGRYNVGYGLWQLAYAGGFS